MNRFNHTKTNPQWQEDTDIAVLEEELKKHQIILHNDDFNTFDYVIESLIEVCEHTPEQAEQCSLIVHFKGKCDVKSGTLEDLNPRCKELLSRGLTAEVV